MLAGLKRLGSDKDQFFCFFVFFFFISTGIFFLHWFSRLIHDSHDSYLNHVGFVWILHKLSVSLSRLQIIFNTSSEDFQGRLAVFSAWKESLARRGIFFLTTSSSPTRVTSTAGVSSLFYTATSCFWVPLKRFFLFEVLFLTPDCFFYFFLFYFANRNETRKARYKKKN